MTKPKLYTTENRRQKQNRGTAVGFYDEQNVPRCFIASNYHDKSGQGLVTVIDLWH